MFDIEKSYQFQFLGRKEIISSQPILAKSLFRFKAKFRTYLVNVEHFDFGLDVLKFCDRKDKKNKDAYTKTFDDYDAIKIFSTCLNIMVFLWRNNPKISFAYYAVPRPLKSKVKNDLRRNKILEDVSYRDKFIRGRYNIYEHAMINRFPPRIFWKAQDYKNSIYVLLNKKDKPKRKIKAIGEYLLKNHEIIFEVDD